MVNRDGPDTRVLSTSPRVVRLQLHVARGTELHWSLSRDRTSHAIAKSQGLDVGATLVSEGMIEESEEGEESDAPK